VSLCEIANLRPVMMMMITVESTQTAQTSAEDVHVLFLAVCRNHNSK